MARGGGGTRPNIGSLDAGDSAAPSDALMQGAEVTEFQTTVDFGSDDELVSVWAPELGLHGSADTYEEAKAILVEQVRFYIQDYLADEAAQNAPGMKAVHQLIVLSHQADQKGELAEFIFKTEMGASKG